MLARGSVRLPQAYNIKQRESQEYSQEHGRLLHPAVLTLHVWLGRNSFGPKIQLQIYAYKN